ncbi:MAG: DUF5056 domain-containing protein [Prevotella sp.]|nr:DUF5056 domain-containing protein [Prevotella sp.]MCI2079346.1 DUF5056 domain-containing protein [Prevotella sp.]MCI2101223.1 DUF5056 domain-containing protein [Prevotella sp.]
MENNHQDDLLVAQFFLENRQEIEDNGFSEQLMRKIPNRHVVQNRIWRWICSVIGVAFFLIIDGVDSLRQVLGNIMGDAIGMIASVNVTWATPLLVIVAVTTILMVIGFNSLFSED